MAAPTELITDSEAAVDFAGALPKAEIQATQFLEQYPEYDGRNVVIAIFDTGVDPGAFGLQTTPNGQPKIIDVVDCTGSGDVNTSKIVTADENGYIESLIGNKLKVNSEWKNPSGEWRVGAAPAFFLLPGGLKHRLKAERRKRFDEHQRAAVTEATAALAAFEAAHGRAPATASPAEIKKREELVARVTLLEELSSKYDDQGPMVEAVVWNDGDKWVAALDTSDFYTLLSASATTTTAGTEKDEAGKEEQNNNNKGALENFGEPLTNFRACGRYGTFSAEDACNYVLNIYDEGDTLSIVVDAGSHGTHVAGIAAGYHPENPALNGIAPGAQIVSCKIGDTRLGSMETMVGLTRALITVLENRCDLINMSYGEATATSNAGRFVRLADEIVNKHGVIFVASAGNAGPALSTVGAPGGTSSAILGIGAFVTPALAAAGHSIRQALDQGTQYTWSSRGPAPDGDIGVTFSAPGGAIAPVPQWSQQRMQLMNGTSMASPCACGGLALLLSALKAEGQVITPSRVRRAVENTALILHPEDPTSTLTYGRGLLQVADAHSYLLQGNNSKSHLDNDILKDLVLESTVRRSDSATSSRGVYLRDPADASIATTWSVEIKPKLKADADVKTTKLEIDMKIEMKVTAPWIIAPELLLLHHNGRSFEVEIDPTRLEQGVHYAEIQGFDAVDEWRGPLFRIPITVMKPLMLAALPGFILAPSSTSTTAGNGLCNVAYQPHGAVVDLGNESFVPGREMRRFVGVPAGATWAELKLKASDSTTTPKSYMVRATGLLPHTRYSDSEFRTFASQVPPRGESTLVFAVHSGTTLEVTIAQFWSSLGDSTLKMELIFHGIEIKTNSGSGNGSSGANGVVIDGAAGTVKVVARAPLLGEKIKPSAKLDTVRIPLRPTDAGVLAPLRAPRDLLPGGRTIHSLLLSYKLSLPEGGKVTPKVPLFNRYVYDSEIEAQMSFTCDENKQLLGVGDIYPDAITLKKGEYTVQLALRHEDPAVLEKFRTLPMLIERKLENAIQVPVYTTNGNAVLGKDAVSKERPLCAGEAVALFLGPVPDDKMPKDATSGRSLVGSFSLGQTSAGKDAPGALSMTYLVPPKKADVTTTAPAAPAAAAADGSGSTTTATAPSSLEIGLFEAVRDAEVKFLSGMKTDTEEAQAAYSRLLIELNEKYKNHLPLLREPLKRLSTKPAPERATPETVSAIISAADTVLAAIDTTELAVFIAAKCPDESEGAAERKKEMDEKKSAVVEALAAKCSGLLEKEDSKDCDEFEACYAQLRRWVDPVADASHAPLAAKREERAGRTALALKALEKSVNPDDKPATKEVLERREELLRALGWEHWAYMEKMKKRMAFPMWTQQYR